MPTTPQKIWCQHNVWGPPWHQLHKKNKRLIKNTMFKLRCSNCVNALLRTNKRLTLQGTQSMNCVNALLRTNMRLTLQRDSEHEQCSQMHWALPTLPFLGSDMHTSVEAWGEGSAHARRHTPSVHTLPRDDVPYGTSSVQV